MPWFLILNHHSNISCCISIEPGLKRAFNKHWTSLRWRKNATVKNDRRVANLCIERIASGRNNSQFWQAHETDISIRWSQIFCQHMSASQFNISIKMRHLSTTSYFERFRLQHECTALNSNKSHSTGTNRSIVRKYEKKSALALCLILIPIPFDGTKFNSMAQMKFHRALNSHPTSMSIFIVFEWVEFLNFNARNWTWAYCKLVHNSSVDSVRVFPFERIFQQIAISSSLRSLEWCASSQPLKINQYIAFDGALDLFLWKIPFLFHHTYNASVQSPWTFARATYTHPHIMSLIIWANESEHEIANLNLLAKLECDFCGQIKPISNKRANWRAHYGRGFQM